MTETESGVCRVFLRYGVRKTRGAAAAPFGSKRYGETTKPPGDGPIMIGGHAPPGGFSLVTTRLLLFGFAVLSAPSLAAEPTYPPLKSPSERPGGRDTAHERDEHHLLMRERT